MLVAGRSIDAARLLNRLPVERQDTDMSSTLALAGLTIIAASGLISLALILRFLWRVYDRGGPTHVRSAAAALREVYDPHWAAKLGHSLPRAGSKKPHG
jgi:hypothetical protein